MPSHCKSTHVSKGSHRPHSTRQIRFHGTEVPHGDPTSILEGKSVMTLMRPKKNALRSSQILLIHSEVLIFGLISSVKQSIQVIFRESAVLETYSILSRQQSCAVSLLLHAVTSHKAQWDRSCCLPSHLASFSFTSAHFLLASVINSQPMSWLVLVSTSVFASTCPDKIVSALCVFWCTKVAPALFFM